MSWQPDDTGMEPLASASGRSSDWQARRGSDFAKAATLVCHVGAAVMFCVIAWALYASTGGVPDNTTQVQWLISNPWGIVSLVDLYVGFTVFSMWIWFREADAIVAAKEFGPDQSGNPTLTCSVTPGRTYAPCAYCTAHGLSYCSESRGCC